MICGLSQARKLPTMLICRSKRRALFPAVSLVLMLSLLPRSFSQSNQKAEHAVVTAPKAASAEFPQLIDITASTGIHFDHLSAPEAKYVVESMSGGVALIDYDRDGYPDIYFTNAQSVEMALSGKKAKSALYHNNHDGTFTDVTDKA